MPSLSDTEIKEFREVVLWVVRHRAIECPALIYDEDFKQFIGKLIRNEYEVRIDDAYGATIFMKKIDEKLISTTVLEQVMKWLDYLSHGVKTRGRNGVINYVIDYREGGSALYDASCMKIIRLSPRQGKASIWNKYVIEEYDEEEDEEE